MSGLDQPFDVVRWYDPELLRHNSAETATNYGIEREASVLDLSGTPIIFRCRLLSRNMRRMVRSQPNEPSQYDMAFRFGVMEVVNLPGPTGPRTVTPMRSQPDEPLSDKVMDGLGLSEDDEQEIGMVILKKSFLGRGVPLSCPLLPSSLHAYSVVVTRLADARKDSETPPDGKQDES